MIDGNITLH